jgi:hypothetical protein
MIFLGEPNSPGTSSGADLFKLTISSLVSDFTALEPTSETVLIELDPLVLLDAATDVCDDPFSRAALLATSEAKKSKAGARSG